MAKKLKSLRKEVMAYLDRNPDTKEAELAKLFKRPYNTMWGIRNRWLEQRTDPNAPEQATLAWDEPDTSTEVEGALSSVAPRVKSNNYIPQGRLVTQSRTITQQLAVKDVPCKQVSDGSTASYYELPEGAKELQDLISYKNMNAQIGEIFRACMRYGESSHSDELRDAKKIRFYIDAEIKRLGG
tara:strand:+ start:8792 stop:9343 length:552 start_codon:yes stop_codon:yes gene_type:complete